MLVWDRNEAAFKADEPIAGRVIERVKGGLAVDVGGVKAFLPGSLIDTKPVKNLDALRGHEYKFKIVSFDKKRNNVVLSRRAIVEVEQAAAKADTFSRLQEGQHTHGIVKNITDYGVFVDLGGVDGLLHITDVSWGRVNHPSEYFNVGDEIEVVVLKFDPAAERVSLGYKQKSQDPWTDVVQRYPLGSKVHGRVVSLTDYGAFIELEEGVEGLIHVSEMSWTKKVRNPSKLLAMGTEVDAVVTDVNVQNRRISLSLKALEQNPWDTIAERYPIGAVVTGKVRNLTDFGAFIEVEDGIDGLIHISDMSWTKRVQHPSEVVKKGDAVDVVILNIDAVGGASGMGWGAGANGGPNERVVGQLGRRGERLHHDPGRRVSLVGWGLGGLYAQELARASPGSVRMLITLGTPVLARSTWTQGVSRMADRVTYLPRTAALLPRPWAESGSLRVPAMSVYTRADGIVAWSACRYPAAPRRQNVEVRGSHLGLAHNPAVLWLLADRLGQAEGKWKPFRPPLALRPFFPRRS